MSQINFQSLEEFIHKQSDDLSAIHLWYEKLSEFEPDGSESPKDIETLIYALKYLMNYSFTAAEELKEVAEHEAVTIAEKEEQWEEQRQSMREEIEDLQQRITSRLDASESSEAFRAQIDSLKEENRILQQLSRDRDMEMADQRDRFETLVARADMLNRERDNLLDQKAQMEDNIRELTRRISSKTDELSSSDWEAKKLRLRNEQAVTLSKQMQAVIYQNDQLRIEVDRVSDALEDATRLIEDSSRRITELTDELKLSQRGEQQLQMDNRNLREKLETITHRLEEVETTAMSADEILKTKIQNQNETITALQQKLYESQIEAEELRARISADTTEEREAELEKLKQELITATKMARALLGQELNTRGDSSDVPDWPRRLMQSENRLQEAQRKIDALRFSAAELEETVIQKELKTDETLAELERLRELKFGDARDELKRLEEQIRFRDEQIVKLSRHCTMLQIELGRYADRIIPDDKADDLKKEEAIARPENHANKPPVKPKTFKPSVHSLHETIVEPEKSQSHSRKFSTNSLEEYEHQAMIIASLNYEIFSLLQELENKNEQLVEMEHSLQIIKKNVGEGKVKLKLAYEEISSLSKLNEISMSTEKEENQIELMELRRFTETIRLGGSDSERRAEEVTRKLINERIQRIRLTRSEENLKTRCARAREAARKFREKVVSTRAEGDKKAARLQYELDITCYEMAVAHNKLQHSVPLKKFEELSKKYRELLKKETMDGGTIEDPPCMEFDLLPPKSTENVQELIAKNQYLKKIAEILTEQNDFWNRETEILQRENEELKRFLEDLENETDAKGVLVSIESRLMETIRELSTIAKEQSCEQRRMRDAEEILARYKANWSAERKRYVHVISLLQQGYQNQRNNNLATITVTQMEILRQKIVEIDYEKHRVKEERDEAEKVKKEIDILKIHTESNVKTNKLINSELNNLQRLERLLRQYMAGEAEQIAKCQRLERLLNLKERQEKQKLEEIEDLQKVNEELLTLISLSKAIFDEKIEQENSKVVESEKDGAESAYEMDIESNSSDSSPPSNRVIIKTVIDDNSVEYTRRLNRIKETAETCIRSYREQLAQKDATIASYKELLLVKTSYPLAETNNEKHTIEIRKSDKDSEEKLKLALIEIAKLKEDVEDLEAANRELFRERKKSIIPLVEDTYAQTDADFLDSIRESEVSIPRQKNTITVIPEETERTDFVEIESPEDPIQDVISKHKQEVKRLQERIKRLTTTNQELLVACEQIKEEAISQLAAKNKRITDNEAEELEQTRMELARLRTETRLLRSKVKTQQEAIDKSPKESETRKKNKEDELARWEERKKMEDTIRVLRRKLKESEEKENESKDRLTKREKRLQEIQTELLNSRQEADRLNKRLSDLKQEKAITAKENQQVSVLKERYEVLEKRIKEKEKELTSKNSKLQSSQNEISKLTQEIQHLRKRLSITEKEAIVIVKKNSHEETLKNASSEKKKIDEELKLTKRELRLVEIHLAETKEKLEYTEMELRKSQESYGKLTKKNTIREDNSTGAVAVLKDKLQAKDREVAQLKSKITQLERRLSQ